MSKSNRVQTQTAVQTQTEQTQTQQSAPNFVIDSRTRGKLEAEDGSIDLIAVRSAQNANGLVEAEYLSGSKRGDRVTVSVSEVKPISSRPGSAGDSPFSQLLTDEEKESGLSLLNLAHRLAGDERPQGQGGGIRYLEAVTGSPNLFLVVRKRNGNLYVSVEFLTENPNAVPKHASLELPEQGALSHKKVTHQGRKMSLITTERVLVIT